MKTRLLGGTAVLGAFLSMFALLSVQAQQHAANPYIPNDHRPLHFAFHEHHGTQRASTPSKAKKAHAKKTALICPVTGDKIASIKAAVGHSTYHGKTYYFCCAGCKPRFDKNPTKFVKNAALGKYEKM